MRVRTRRHVVQQPLLLGLLAFIVATAAGTLALAATSDTHPDYQGTYAGIATTNTRAQAPFTLFVYKRGDTMEITVASKGYTVRVKAPENWTSKDSVKVNVTVPGVYKTIATGAGTATFAKSATLWKATGGGSGTLLLTKSGQVAGEAQMVTRGFDQSKADAWIAAHPIKGQNALSSADDASPIKALNTATPKVDKALLVVAPAAARPPVPDPEKLEILALLGLLMAILMVSDAFFGGKKPLREFQGRWTRKKAALNSRKVPEGGV
jgi:hypothetical protein